MHSRRGHINLINDIRGFGSGDKDGWIDSTKRIIDGYKRYAGDGARTMHKTGVELWESGAGYRESMMESRYRGIDLGS